MKRTKTEDTVRSDEKQAAREGRKVGKKKKG